MTMCNTNADMPLKNRVGILTNDGDSFHCRTDETLLAGALRAGVGFPYECNSGSCGSCKFDLLDGELEAVDGSLPLALSPREQARGKRLACQCYPRSDCRIAFRTGPAPVIRPSIRQARLLERRPLTHDLWQFHFRTEDPAHFLPGQYALLHLPGVPLWRAYSMANLANGQGDWYFQIKHRPGGTGSAALFEDLPLGAQVRLDGPYGNAHLRLDTSRDIVCVAGGSGLAPMLSIIRGGLQAPELAERRLLLFYAGRTERDLVTLEALGELAGLGERWQYLPVLSQESTPDWNGLRGPIQEQIVAHLPGVPTDYRFYLAGPPAMVEATRRMLVLEQHLAVEHIHYDRFF